jgi:uncharacterized protein (TIGR02118 family)
VQSHVLPTAYAKKAEPVYDGIAEVWADDTDALREMAKSSVHSAVVGDEAKFIDRSKMGFIVTEEHVAKDGFGHLKAVEFFTRRPDLSVEAFQAHWRGAHAALATKVPGVRRYVASMTRASASEGGRTPAYDGAALMWFEAAESLKTAATSDEYKALVADRAEFLAPGQPPFILTREYVIVG